MPTIGQHPITKITNIILGEGEMITAAFNSEKIVVYRRDSTTNWEVELIKPLGTLASVEQLRVNAPQVCNYNEGEHDPNPIHEHEDGTWWFFDELWSLENGPFTTFLMPAAPSAGKCANPTSRLGAMRSRSLGSRSCPKSHGVVVADQGTPARS